MIDAFVPVDRPGPIPCKRCEFEAMEILFLLFLIVLNGFFAMSEIALVTSRSGRLARLAADGDDSAALALQLNKEPTRVLSTIQIGITAIGILNGIVGESVLAMPLARTMQTYGIDRNTSEISATVLVVVLITYLSIVVGELVPKRIGQFHAETIARFVSRPIAFLARIASPFVKMLSVSTEGILSLVIRQSNDASNVTEEDIEALLDEGSISGTIATQERDLVKNVFRLDERPIRAIMIPAVDIVWLDANAEESHNRSILLGSGYSRFPVCEGELGHPVGVATAKNLLDRMLETGRFEIKRNLEPIELIPESLTGIEILDKFRLGSYSMAFVIDEYGEVAGMVTLQDLLEVLAGEFGPVGSEETDAFRRQDGSWILDGLLAVQDLEERLALASMPGGEKPPYQTVSGMLMFMLERLPDVGEICEWEGWRFEVLDRDGNRVDKVLATPVAATLEPNPASDPAAET